MTGCGLGDFGEGEALCEKALRCALEIDDTTLYVYKGYRKEAAEHLQKCIRYQEEKELIPLTGVAWTHLCLDNEISLLAEPTPRDVRLIRQPNSALWS